MKLHVELNKEETIEAMYAFGVPALMPHVINEAAGYTKNTHSTADDTFESFSHDIGGSIQPLRDAKIKPSDAVDAVIDILFGFEYGTITRDEGDWVVELSTGEKVDVREVEPRDDRDVNDLIVKSIYTIDIVPRQ